MKIISFEDIRSLNISPLECYRLAEWMILHKKEAILPPKTHIALPGNVFCNIMPSVVNYEGMSFGGTKIVTRYPARKPSLDSRILLFDAKTGEFQALMDGSWITAMRTGAVCAHAVKNFHSEAED